MTAVMRAIAVESGPKVLRIGIVQGGRLVEERIVKHRTSVTVGDGETAMFSVPGEPGRFELFERAGDDYWLNLRDEMHGRIALDGAIYDLQDVRGSRRAERRENVTRIRLTDDARGRIVLRETAILFQFVSPPPAQPRPQLPLSAKMELSRSIDWRLTIIAAFSFLLHFGFIGAMYSDWMDPAVDENISIRGLVDSSPPMAPAPPTEMPADAPSPSASAIADRPEPRAAANAKARAERGEGASSDRAAAALAREAEALEVQWIATAGAGPAVERALRRGDVPPVNLGPVASAAVGVATEPGIRVGPGAVIEPGKRGRLAEIGQTRADGAGERAGEARNVRGPVGEAQILSTQTPASLSDAESVVARLRPKFRNCYQHYGLSADPGMSGAATIVGKVAANGEVDSAEASDVSGLSPAVVTCLQRVVKDAQFTAPHGVGATVRIPIKFVQQSP